MPLVDPSLASEPYCYLTTTGRASGRPHTIEIWFGLSGDTVYLLSGAGPRSDWVRNLRRSGDVRLRIGARSFAGHARFVATRDENALARRLLLEKYAPTYAGDLTTWGRESLAVAIDASGVMAEG